MRIKNIRQFRTLFKEKIRSQYDNNRNEHFIGVRKDLGNDIEEFGFFDLYHGEKEGYENIDGIRSFLEGLLDMAKDGQAVYEFLQNAVDAYSTKFFLLWGKDEIDGKDYLLVANNGRMFDVNGVRSILNVGESTKSTDRYTIGKYGIGFKLAHRLVGKLNGLDELIDGNQGPILFSWGNNELNQFAALDDTSKITPVEQEFEIIKNQGKKKAICHTQEPWLFKILITNFPCQPENFVIPEIIRDYKYKERDNAFSKKECEVLLRWVKKHKDHFNNGFESGSLFFICLGEGKEEHLAEENLEEGVRFSITILNKIAQRTLNHSGLSEVILREKTITPVPIRFEEFLFKKGTPTFRYIRFGKKDDLSEEEINQEANDADIEVLFGYTDHAKSEILFQNAPNFYLFFPLSEEKHEFRFILHSNAFYKSSSRTYLQKSGIDKGINERIFKCFTSDLIERLSSWAGSNAIDKKQALLEIYAILLLSNASTNPERVWVNKPLWEPIYGYLKNIPIKSKGAGGFEIVTEKDNVRIKKTIVPIDNSDNFSNNYKWFFWDNESEPLLCSEARVKLSLTDFTIIDLLNEDEIVNELNHWLEGQETEVINLVIKEINDNISIGTGTANSAFIDNLAALNLWKFKDGNFSINELAKETTYRDRVLLFEAIDPIKTYLQKAGFNLPEKSLSETPQLFTFIQSRYQSQIKYIRSYTELFRVFNYRFANTSFLPSEKIDIVKALGRRLKDDKEDRVVKIRELQLFKNKKGKVVPLKSLLKSTERTWLNNWCIVDTEYNELLDDYLAKSSADIYQNIIIENWSDLIEDELLTPDQLKQIYSFCRETYEQNSSLKTLEYLRIVKIRGKFYDSSHKFFYRTALHGFNAKEYEHLILAEEQIHFGSLPDIELLEFYSKKPFKIDEAAFQFDHLKHSVDIPLEQAKAFLKLFRKVGNETLSIIIFSESSIQNQIKVCPKKNEVEQVIASVPALKDYLLKYRRNDFVIFPDGLSDYRDLVALTQEKLLVKLLLDYYIKNQQLEDQLSALLSIASKMDIEVKLKVLQIIKTISFDLKTPIESKSSGVQFIQLAISSFTSNEEAFQCIRKVVSITHDNGKFNLADANLIGSENVSFKEDEPILLQSRILTNPNSESTKQVSNLIDNLIRLEIADANKLAAIFGLSNQTDKSFIYNELIKQQGNKPLENAYQLAFVLKYLSENPALIEKSTFKVSTFSGVSVDLKEILYAPIDSNQFIPAEYRLNPKYNRIDDLLQLSEENPCFAVKELVSLIKQPVLRGNQLYFPGKFSIPSDQHESFLNYLFSLWEKQNERPTILDHGSNTNWEKLLGFHPKKSIWGNELNLKNERLPGWLIDWTTKHDSITLEDDTYLFLRALGVSMMESDILSLRAYLVGKTDERPIINYEIPPKTLHNSLILLEELKCRIGVNDHERINNLSEILKRSGEEINKGLPVIEEQSNDCISISSNYSKKYISENDAELIKSKSFSIGVVCQSDTLPIVYGPAVPQLIIQRLGLKPLLFIPGVIDGDRIEEISADWEGTFYKDFNKQYPNIRVKTCLGQIPKKVRVEKSDLYFYQEDDICVHEDIIYINRELDDIKKISLLELHGLLQTEELEYLKELFENHDLVFRKTMHKIQSNSSYKELWEKLQKYLTEEEKRQELSEGMGKYEKYSFAWFKSLLGLIGMNEKDSGLDNPYGEISFSKIQYKDTRVISLREPSKFISPNIENFTDFKAKFSYKDESKIKEKKIEIKGVSKKGQELLIIPTDQHEFATISMSSCLGVTLSFVRTIDLAKRLEKAFKDLDLCDNYNLRENLTENIDFIFGPPGTGKTTKIASDIINKIRSGNTSRIIILTPTNKAADVLVKKILELGDKQGDIYPDSWVVRYGESTDLDLLDREVVYNSSTFKFLLYEKLVLATTIDRFPYESINTGENELGIIKKPLKEIDWETIIFDESSMIMLPAIVFALYKRKFRDKSDELTKFVISGDPLQLPPVVDIPNEDLPENQKEVKEENIYTMIGLNSFNPEDQNKIPKYGNRIKNLDKQFRSISSIGDIFSKFQYNGLLKHGRDDGEGGNPNPRTLPDYFYSLGIKPITVIKYPVNSLDTIYNPQKLNNSYFQLYSAFLVNELVRKFRIEASSESWNIGVICPYRSQASLVNKMIESHSVENLSSVITDTVHGFQGDECDAVFVVLSPNSAKVQSSYFLKKEYIINVAISRAKDYLIIFIPDDNTNGLNQLSLIHESYPKSILSLINDAPPDKFAILSAKEVERKLMGEFNYFENNSFTNAHQAVNVYGIPEMRYMVRSNGSAIDIHWKV